MASEKKRQAAANGCAQQSCEPTVCRALEAHDGSEQRAEASGGLHQRSRLCYGKLKGSKFVQQAIQCETRFALRCTLSVKKQHVQWLWEQDRAVVSDQHCSDAVGIAIRGAHLSIFTSASCSLMRSEAAQCVRYEDVRLRSKKRSHAHPSRQQFKSLGSQDCKFFHEDQSKQQQSQDGEEGPMLCQIPTSVFTKHQVRQVSCGISHCIALVTGRNGGADGDSLLAWGIGMYGQLGLGDQQVANTMTRIDTSPEFEELLQTTEVTLRCGPFATYVFIKNSSIVWHWGLLPSSASSSFTTCTTSERFVLQGVPIEFPMIDGSMEIAGIAVGVEHIVLLSASGRVFTWGFGASGQLGLGHERSEVVDEIAQPVDFFHSPEQLKIVAITSGWHHTLALASDQSIFAWGSNRLGACGATTKFHEYFAPVRVPIQLPRAPISDHDEQCEISCCGNTSMLTTRSRSSGLLTTAFAWGVCSKSVASLTPVEVSDVRHQGRFRECQAGSGALHWVYRADSEPSKRDDPCSSHQLLQIERAEVSSATGNGATGRRSAVSNELLAFDVALDELVRLRLTDLRSDEEAAPVSYSVDHLRIRKVRMSELDSSLQVVKLVMPLKSEQVGALDVQLRAITPGTVNVELVYDGHLVFGSRIEVRVEQKRAQGRLRAGVRGPSHLESIEVYAVSVVNSEQMRCRQQLVLADLAWKPAAAKRVRIYDDDTFMLLIEGLAALQVESSLRLEDPFGSTIQAEISLRGFAESTTSTLAAIAVRCPWPGVYSLVLATPHGSDASFCRRRLVDVVCAMNASARSAILSASGSYIEKALTASGWGQGNKVSTRAAFSVFVSTLLSSASLRDAIANTPLAATADVESERVWDIDCEAARRRVLRAHHRDPFVLWKTDNLVSALISDMESPDVDVDYQEGQMRFWDVLPKWTLGDPSVVELSLASAVENSTGRDREESSCTLPDEDDEENLEEARAEALQVGLSVHQSPREFLVHGNLVSDCSSSVSQQSSVGDTIKEMGVTTWRDQHGELFYTSQSGEMATASSSQPSRAEYRIQVYGHESHHFRETVMGSRVGQLKTKLHHFLWELLNEQQCSIADLFQCFLFELGSTTSSDGGGHIQLRGFVSTLEGLGFSSDDGPGAPSKQEWLTLFTEIQRLAAESASTPPRVTRSVFKTFLIDPFHTLFWRHYVGVLQSLASPDTIVQTLLAEFCPTAENNVRLNDDEHQDAMPYSDFVDSLRRFHEALTHNYSSIGSKKHEKGPSIVLSAPDCCRLLYRFDVHCSGWISARLFQQSVISSFRRDIGKSNNSSQLLSAPAKEKMKQRTAVRNAKRPDVDAFSTPNAVQKLFLARAQHQQHKPHDPTSRATTTSDTASTRKALMHAGNTHLARIRSLPVSKLLREGVHFRPQLHGNADTTAAAEQSF